MHYFLKLTLKNDEKTFVNMNMVCEMRKHEDGARIFFQSTPGEYDFIEVKESCEEIYEKF